MINDVLDKIIDIATTVMEQMKTGSLEEKSFEALNGLTAIAGIAGGAKSMDKKEESKLF